MRVLAVNGKTELARDTILVGQAEMVVYGDVAGLQAARLAGRPHGATQHSAEGSDRCCIAAAASRLGSTRSSSASRWRRL